MKSILNNPSYHTINQIDNNLINQDDIIVNNSILNCLNDYLEDITDLEIQKDKLLSGYFRLETQKTIKNLKIRRTESKIELKRNWIIANPNKSFDDWILPIFQKLMFINIEYNKQFNVF